jgi:hypothetical protein
MRDRTRLLENLEALYRESYDRASDEGQVARMAELDNAYMRDQLLFEVLLDLRDLFTVAPAAKPDSSSALEKFETLRRITKLK